MPREHSPCNLGQIEQLLEGRLTSDEQSQVEEHLDACTACRNRLESTAAEHNFWTAAAAHLRDDAFDQEVDKGAYRSLADLGGLGSGEHLSALRIADYFDPTDDPRMLGRFGGYEIVGVVGCGGMGVVLKGFEAALDRYVAVKVLSPYLATSGAARARFAREARAAAAVLHENVVAIHRVDEASGLPYLVMPYVPGDSLQKRLDEQGPLQLAEILRIGMQIAAGLAAAHAQGLIHRDIKPGNILLDKGVERVTITDFGLARAADDASLTHSGVIAGTPQYMSPEQSRGEPLDGRSDLFSLGSVLYAMCIGRPPFRAETAFGVLQRISESQPTAIRQLAPEVPEWLCEIITKLHAKKAGERFQSASEVANLLGECLAHVQQPTTLPLPASLVLPFKGSRFLSFSPRSLGAIVVIAAVALGSLRMVLWQAAKAPDTNESRLTPGSVAAITQLAEPQPQTMAAMPRRVHHFQTGASVKTVACSADGKLIAIANGDPTFIMLTNGRSRVIDNWKPSAEILDAETGKTVVSLKLTTDDEDTLLAATERVPDFEVAALAFSPDGNVVAVGTSVGQVKLFNARTGELVRSLDDEQAKLADKKTPEKLKSLTRAMGSVASLAFSPDGSLLATCGGSFNDDLLVPGRIERMGLTVTGPGRLKVWEVQTGTLKHDLVGHDKHADAVAFSPDGNLLGSAGRWFNDHNQGTGVIIWNPHTGTKIRTFTTPANGGTWSVAFSPDSKLVAIGSLSLDKDKAEDASTGAVSLAHVASGITDWLVTVPGWAKPAAFSPDGRTVAVLCGGRSIRFLDTETGAVKHEIRSADSPQGGRWNDFAIAPERHMLAIGGVDREQKGSIELWDFDGNEIVCLGAFVADELPSPFGRENQVPSPGTDRRLVGRGAGGEGKEQVLREQTFSDAARPHPNPLPAGEGTAELIPDERALYEECRRVREQISQMEREWSRPPSPGDDTRWQSTVSELQQRADDLGQRIEQNLP